MAERQVRVAVVMDDSSYVAGGASVVSTNTKIATSSEDLAAVTKKTADAQIAAILRVREASKLRIASLQNIATNAPNLETQTAATVALQREQAKLARTYGETTTASAGFSRASRTAEGDVSKFARGTLAGSGALSSLGRSLAFASNAFIGLAIGAQAIKGSIGAAEQLDVAQRQVNTQLKTSGKSFQEYGTQIDSVLQKESALSGFTQTELLQGFGFLVRVTGNVSESLKLTGVAADVARARNISLASAAIALGKALGGSETALKRLGITIPKGLDRMQALTYVQEKFAGQAEAGATAGEKFHAVLVDTGATIGQALLPTFVRLTTNLSDWLVKMNQSGKLTKDVSSALSIAGTAFHALASAIRVVDDVTGSFKTTLELLIGLKLGFVIAGWITSLERLAVEWGLVKTAAQEAQVAEAGAAGGAGLRAKLGGLLGGAIGAGGAALAASDVVSANRSGPQVSGFRRIGSAGDGTSYVGPNGDLYIRTPDGVFHDTGIKGPSVAGTPVVTAGLRNLGQGGSLAPSFLPDFGGTAAVGQGGSGAGPFGTAKPIPIFKSFTDTIGNQLDQARAALTKSTADDVAAAKAEIALIKREIDKGHLKGASLLQALQAESTAVSTIQSAQAAAIQQQTTRIQAQIDPLRLEVSLSRAQALGQSTLPALRALRAAAQGVIDSGKATLAEQKQAYDQITSLNQQIQQAITQGLKQFTEPLKLQIALAREQAFGQSTIATLEAMKKAALKALRSGQYTGQALIALYNEIASINQQLASSATAGLGKFRQLSLRKLTSDLGLTKEQQKALEARLSQVGPGGTVPGSGTGAFGFAIGPDGRTRGSRHPHVTGGGATAGGAAAQQPQPIKVVSDVTLEIDGAKLARIITTDQQRQRRHDSSQRRGPHAGGTG